MKTAQDFARAAVQMGQAADRMKPEDNDPYATRRKLIRYYLLTAAKNTRELAEALAAKVADLWGDGTDNRYVVITGGEPMLQVDDGIVDALHTQGFQIAIESNGTIAVHPGVDWVCISPKAGSDVIQRTGDELKLVWPQPTRDLDAMEQWQFAHFLIQPMDMGEAALNATSVSEATRFVMARPKWRLSLQNHKILGLP